MHLKHLGFSPQSWVLPLGYKTSKGGAEGEGGGGLKNLPQFRLLQSRLTGFNSGSRCLNPPRATLPMLPHPRQNTLKTTIKRQLPTFEVPPPGQKNATVNPQLPLPRFEFMRTVGLAATAVSAAADTKRTSSSTLFSDKTRDSQATGGVCVF